MNRLSALAMVGLVACSGSTGGTGGNGGGTGTGGSGGSGGGSEPVDAGMTTVTLSGARTSSLVSSAPSASYTPAVTNSEVAFLAGNAVEQVSFDFQFSGEPTARTYVGDVDAGIFCNVFDTLDGGLDGWLANHGAGIADVGDCALTLTSVALKQDVGTQKSYFVHGSVAATLPARSGNATGTIDFAASF